ncbi:polyhydroxyalkanoate depolymerase [Croceicoccus sp. BE223]|uniref:polyhydroxyalkanoate depolymerase n=1 Tax=Croceicoccus sp. BE223 TaxID=2817716 RepID=UPI002859979C|nr:polyhydroxyalkanoate depolymerase [Croceicoccus sp. BE223]MDR7102079.1 poly(3-hydroxybutyrate) depolymerase [Croceicoccus sp. BE223]
MLYQIYEVQRAWLAGASAAASIGAEWLANPRNPLGYTGFGPAISSAMEVFSHAAAPRTKPAFGIRTVESGGKTRDVIEADVLHRPFGNLKRFTHAGLPADAPKLLIVAPMSGHYATLLRGTVERMLENAEVYITDWADAKLVPMAEGSFDLDDYIDYVISFLEHIGPGTHVMAVCQPSVPAFAATAVMNEDRHPCRPATLTMMGGPIDTRQAPTEVNDMATTRPLAWFRQNLIQTVPVQYPGGGRRVYPGFLQLAGFMSMNLGNHMMSHYAMFKHLVVGDGESAEATKIFYDEYLAVCDMTAEFYLQTVNAVFKEFLLPRGLLTHRGRKVDAGAITDTAILCIEGERDDISGVGQTRAALDITPNLPDARKQYHLATGVGHYGIFNGSKWRSQIAPIAERWMADHARGRLQAVA